MRIIAEQVNNEPGVSDHNPKGLPEVTITEVRCPEFGPVSIGASPHATAQLRSGTDDFYETIRSRDSEAWAQARSAAGLTSSTVETDAGGAVGGAKQTPLAVPDTGRAAIARLIGAGISTRSNT
jgi:hypothetical protein